MRLNNKGTTVVELIVSFSLLVILMLGMLNLVYALKADAKQKMFEQEMRDYKNMITTTIYQDIIFKKVSDVITCSSNNLVCYDIAFIDGTSAKIIVDVGSKVIRYDGLIYEIPNKNEIELSNVSISYDNNILDIDIPVYQINNTINYGINITAVTDL